MSSLFDAFTTDLRVRLDVRDRLVEPEIGAAGDRDPDRADHEERRPTRMRRRARAPLTPGGGGWR